ncbi:hypothetical protein [Acinetobacter brisouii]|uniref:hypothetical protein n=1 Tax=Acinetobacter brisouii TaxID=396323 RepID=UPI00125031F9|nr:hypothetical protein [Acinetobacter brisouii]
MKANEFVKNFGWEYAKHILTDDAPLVIDLNYTDLKRLVESHELVFEHGSIDRARKYADSPYTAPEIKVVLDKAIADVESCS